MIENSKILVTGAFGNLGSWVGQFLLQHNFDVTLAGKNFTSELYPDNSKFLKLDITDKNSCEKILRNEKYTHVIHLASANDYFEDGYADRSYRVNAIGTANLLQTLNRESLTNFIYVSTVHVYGKTSGLITESSSPSPENDYATSHLFGEYFTQQAFKKFKIPYTIFRLSNSYGCPKSVNTKKWYLALNDLCKNAHLQNRILLQSNGKAQRDFIWMGNVCEILSKCSTQNGSNKIYNLCSGKNISIMEIAQIVKIIYVQKFNKSIDIVINETDKNTYTDSPIYSNKKLLNDFKINLYNNFEIEIENIFSLLKTSRLN